MSTTKKPAKKASGTQAAQAAPRREYTMNTNEQTFIDGLNADVSRAEIARTQARQHWIAYLVRLHNLDPNQNWSFSADERRLVVAEQQTMVAGAGSTGTTA